MEDSAFLAPRRFVLFSSEIEIYARNHSRTGKENPHHYEDNLKTFLCDHMGRSYRYDVIGGYISEHGGITGEKCLKCQDTS
jgi:hypothetical protein